MFERVLTANRGEIACRVMRTCARLGVETVAVYSESEGAPLHAELADHAVILPSGPNPVAEYLDIGAVIEAALRTGADAIHPGYGFLSENADFATACADAGIAFIGPAADVVRSMGNKREARRRLAAGGVPILPGSAATLDGSEDAQSLAESVGFPLMVKASEGGGGIGMQLVTDPRRLGRAIDRARSSARRSFGSEDVYLEKFIMDARHVEVQILADSSGVCAHLWERECSIQRRRQKVIEEAPSPSMSEQARDRLIESAVGAARSLGYTNAGTFEFVVDGDDAFYFLEANTRLQVEHGVTEMVTGVDIVEQQLRIAAGYALDVGAARVEGHSIQCRIYAEDPQTFIPSPGRLSVFHMPQMENVRVDTGFRAGDEVTPFFDPLLSKIIVWGESRGAAVSLMSGALSECRVEGVKTNVPALRSVIARPDFLRGRYTTGLLAGG